LTLGFARYPFVGKGAGLARGFLSTVFYIYKHLEQKATLQDVPILKVATRDESGNLVMSRMVNSYASALLPKELLHVAAPGWFHPLKGTRNHFFTMWEADKLPEEFVETLNGAQSWIVPSQHNKALWARYGFDAKVVPLGVHEAYTLGDPDRSRLAGPGGSRPLRFLFVGSQSPRKGWPVIAPAYAKAFSEMVPNANVQLIVKTIQNEGEGKLIRSEDGKVLVDTRDLSATEMLGLYRYADVFLFPSLGEGFGLPPLEAMASGALAVSTANTGLSDFIDDGTAFVIPQTIPAELQYGTEAQQIMLPSVDKLAEMLAYVYQQWGTPDVETRRQSGCIRARSLTWDNTCTKLLEAIAS
jgi:glycosyltransferase involved in cell wall biosynthesis